MSPGQALDRHINNISTLWSVVHQAHGGPVTVARTALQVLLERYSAAIRRYLLGALRCADAADEVFQEFTLRLLRGDFRNAHPERGRFRDLVKTALFHLVIDYQRRQKARPQALSAEVTDPNGGPSPHQAEQQFRERWREELLEHTWQTLEQVERATGQPCYTVLRCRVEQPLLSSAELATLLATRLGKSFTVDGIRQALRRARDRFADLLLQEVSQSLENPCREELEQELAEVGLQSYCQAALCRWRPV